MVPATAVDPTEVPSPPPVAPAAGRLHVVPYGASARQIVAAVVAEVQAADRLAPVTVVVPSALAGLSLRRSLGAAGGLVAVRTRSLPQLAGDLGDPWLAAAGRLPLTPARRSALVRAALRGGGGRLAAVGPAGEAAVAATFADLGRAGAPALEALAARGGRTAELVAAYRRYRRLTASWYDEADLLATAADVAAGGGPGRAAAGHVVLWLPRRLAPAEVALVGALAGPPGVTALVGRTGDPAADEPADRLVGLLAPLLGAPVAVPTTAAPAGNEVVSAPDPEEEVAIAVRRLVAWLAADRSHRADRFAIATRLASPYDLLLAEALDAAGIAHHAPPTRTLAQSVAGRALVGLLALPDRRFARADVVRWLRSAPVLDGGGHPVRADRWDRLAREAGVVAGPDQWATRLPRHAAALRERADARRAALADAPPVEESPGQATPSEPDRAVDRLATEADEAERLAAFVAELVEAVDPERVGDLRGWPAVAAWAATVLRRYLGGPAHRAGWPEAEQAAADRVTALLDDLATLDDVEPGADVALLRRVLERELAAPVPGGGFGRGVVVARLADLAGVEVDELVVLGMEEGRFPPGGGDDPLLPDRVRQSAGVDLAPRAPTRAEEHRDLLAALAGAGHRVVSWARTDPRAERRLLPAPWLLDTAAALAGRPVRSHDLRRLAAADGAPWLVEAPSFAWWLGDGRDPATVGEWEVAALLAGHRPGVGTTDHGLLAAVPALGRGVEAARARRLGEFSRWSGRVGARPELRVTDGQPRSATSVETWATCPFRYLLATVLRVAAFEDPADADTIGPMARGALVHDVLEQFVAGRLGVVGPGEPWGPADLARLRELADEARLRAEEAGWTGRPLLWRLEWSRMVHDLTVALDVDSRHRAASGTAPVAVEYGFGTDDSDDPPVVVDLPDGRRIGFRGRIDRIDAAGDGSLLEVLDYKTGGTRGYEALQGAGDLTAGGTRLQLAVYARAARARWGDAPVDAAYWFVTERARYARVGGRVDAEVDRRLGEVLAVVADGIEAGHFPARPGEDDGWFGPVHCRGCPYDRVCPTSRSEQWESVRHDPDLAGYLALVEPEPEAEGGP